MTDQTFTIKVAMSVRAYGTIEVTAASREEAIKQATRQRVIADFEPHGSSDDIDYDNPFEICLTSVEDEDGKEFVFVVKVPDPDDADAA